MSREQAQAPITAAPLFPGWLEERRRLVDAALAAHLTALQSAFGPHSRLGEAVLYSVRVGGKRLRPILVLESCEVCGGTVQAALPAALAMELVHTFSLIHDDLPAMDDDDLRRGQPTSHKVFGEATAILAGDWLVTHALGLVATAAGGRHAARLVAALAGGTERMIAGQAADVDGETRSPDADLVRYIHANKTAALLETCCRLGALCAAAPADVVATLADYGRHLGLAFQIADDLLDETGTTEQLGKRTGKDAAGHKQTYPAVFGMDESRTCAQRAVEAALAALAPLEPARTVHLKALAHYVIGRDH